MLQRYTLFTFSFLALIILNKHFANPAIITEKFPIVSCVWSSDNVLMYTTHNHLKYSLLNGDTGILRCLEAPVYLLQVCLGLICMLLNWNNFNNRLKRVR